MKQSFTQLQALVPELKDVQLHTSENWSANHAQYRELLRQEIMLQFNLTEAVLQLDKVPTLPKGFLSISHSLQVGGYVYSPNRPVGLDLESTTRISTSIVKRVSTQDELSKAPSAAHLWCAKEALFKALRGEAQPKVISNIVFDSWQSIENYFLAYSKLGKAYVWCEPELQLTAAIATVSQ